MSAKRNPALGKGLEALLGDTNASEISDKNIKTNTVTAEIANIPLSEVIPNPNQPRKEFNEQTLKELSQSIKEHGVITPITVNKQDGKYLIIAGERRYRASKLAGLTEIPAYIRIVTSQETMEMSLIENIQREDLNSIEIALSLQALLEATNFTQEQLSAKLGKSRTTITNYIRLLKLPAEIQLALRNDKISMGHARSIIGVEDENVQINIVREIIQNDLSVRQVEQRVARLKKDKIKTETSETAVLPERHSALQKSLSEKLNSMVEVKRSKRGKGTISIPFSNDKDFERISQLLQSNL
ncbi:MAG: ParB/RepB/Spo0J family partition protein [Bacteroidales bacterium]|nr:ParB/RepB/Spo0J family partition protein [Bacteroidales bacterium]